IPGAVRGARRESGAEVGRKSQFRQSRPQTCLFSLPTIPVIERSRLRCVRRILWCYLRGGAGSLFRGREKPEGIASNKEEYERRFLFLVRGLLLPAALYLR